MIEVETVQVPEKKFYSWLSNTPHYVINSFKIGKCPVTQAQYEAVMGINPSEFRDNPQNPVERVSWNDAQVFCQKLNQITGKTYRLPTVEEWEYACRAGTTTDYYFGDDKEQLKDYAWYNANSQKTTHPVGQKKPNAWGLYDMIGNVWELCQDNGHFNYDQKKVMCGGSWFNNPEYCLYKFNQDRNRGSGCIGFRVVCDD